MATYTSNYGWTKPSGSDNVDISVLNNNLDGQDGVIHDAFLNMAPPFSESSTYAVDDIVLYTTGLYKCHTAVVTPGSWTGATNWQVYKLSEGGGGGGGTSDYPELTNKPQINGVTLLGNKTTSDLGINADNVMMSDGVTSVEDALDEIISHNKIIYMNDSFGENVTPNISTLVPSQMGWTSADYYGIVKGGSGFGSSAPYNYLTLLQNNASLIASHFDNVDDVSDVIVTGGTNDSYYGDSDTVIKNGISEFVSYVNQTYPNAKITIIFTGWTDSSGAVTNLTFSNIKRAIVDYEYICQIGGRFFDLHNILHQHSLFNGDHIHPTVVAQHMIADAITSLLKGGEYHVARTLDVDIVPASGVTVTNSPISLRFTQNDDIITARFNRSSNFWYFAITAIASTPNGELNNILLGTFSDWIIGSSNTGENKLITNCVVGFDGGAKVIPVIFTFENGNIYCALGNYDTTSKSYTVNACGTESVSFSSYNC